MLKTFRIAYALKNTYRVNGIIYSIKQIPLIRRLLPDSLYRIRRFKILANVLSALWEVCSAFLGKLLYLFCMVFGIGLLYEPMSGSGAFLHIFFLLTLIGTFANTYLFDPTRDKYYGISLMRMNARTYMLSYYAYSILRVIVGFLPFTILFGRLSQVPLWICILMPFFVAAGKLLVAAILLRTYERTGKDPDENKLSKWKWLVVVILLVSAYAPTAMGVWIPSRILAALMILVIVCGIPAVREVVMFPCYHELCRQMLVEQRDGMDADITSQKILEESSRSKISADTSIGSAKKGFEYFNELFMKRHKKILWNSVRRQAAVCLLLVIGLSAVCLLRADSAENINKGIMRFLPVFLFVMYVLNRGTTFTQALFVNCDHSMLTYSFYKKPGNILKLFWIRLREITKINLLPALVIGGGLSLLLYVSGGTKHPVNYVVLPVALAAMSIFFSVHYLTLYYLLQPYNAETELKSGTYKIVSWVTYFFCYMMMQVRMDSLVFGAVMIGFAAAYCMIAGVLVYQLAGRTFRLR